MKVHLESKQPYNQMVLCWKVPITHNPDFAQANLILSLENNHHHG